MVHRCQLKLVSEVPCNGMSKGNKVIAVHDVQEGGRRGHT